MTENKFFLPKVSIVTVVYNNNLEIQNTIESVISQTYRNIEYIVIDGGSTDGTVDIIEKYQDNVDYFVSESDLGIYDAMNKGILAAQGEYIHFLNAGDSFYTTHTLVDFISQFSTLDDVIYGDTCLRDNGNQSILAPTSTASDWKHMPYCHQSVIVKREHLIANLFDLKYKIAGDYDQYHRLKKRGLSFRYIPLIISNYEINGFSTQNTRLLLSDYRKISLLNYTDFITRFKIFLFFIRCELSFIKGVITSRLKNKSE